MCRPAVDWLDALVSRAFGAVVPPAAFVGEGWNRLRRLARRPLPQPPHCTCADAGNDGLIFVGMPLSWPYAWLAFASMCAAIAAAQLLQRLVVPSELKIKELRAKAKAELGERFDLRRFHNALIDNGALPLSVLEQLVNEWIVGEKARTPAN